MVANHRNKVRIIGGLWRNRKIAFPDLPDLRPTPDRIRETLFNWLAPYIEGACCLDLFAGSGVLGFEALSRGARHVTLVDSNRAVLSALEQTKQLLYADNCDIIHGYSPQKMPQLVHAPYDIVFMDPPYRLNLVEPSANWLTLKNYLNERAFVYIESEQALSELSLPTHWHVYRQRKTANFEYGLYCVERVSHD